MITCREIDSHLAVNVKELAVSLDPEQETQPLVVPVAVETR